ncbi:hypothetical protein OK016_13015 [Vibrio chagasii]|nr:hypothetical protein [Vibrio chagasii]
MKDAEGDADNDSAQIEINLQKVRTHMMMMLIQSLIYHQTNIMQRRSSLQGGC